MRYLGYILGLITRRDQTSPTLQLALQHESSDCQVKLKRMIIRQLDSLVGQGRMRNATSVQGKGKQRVEEADSDSEEQLV